MFPLKITVHLELCALGSDSHPALFLPAFNHKWSMQSTSGMFMHRNELADQSFFMVNHGNNRKENEKREIFWHRNGQCHCSIYIFTVIRLTASHLSKIIAIISSIPHSRISFENASLISEHSLFVCWSFVTGNLACSMITPNENIECNDLFVDVTHSICAVVKLRLLEKAECLWQLPRCLQCALCTCQQ